MSDMDASRIQADECQIPSCLIMQTYSNNYPGWIGNVAPSVRLLPARVKRRAGNDVGRCCACHLPSPFRSG